MVTKWFKNSIKIALQGQYPTGMQNYCYNLPSRAVDNRIYYPTNVYAYNNASFTLNATSVGISVGSGNNAATDEDYNLQTTITAGLSGTVTGTKGIDSNGRPYSTFNVVLSNTTTSDIVVREIGFKANINAGTNPDAIGNNSNRCYLIDRTVLPEPVTVPAGSSAAILYTLRTEYDFT